MNRLANILLAGLIFLDTLPFLLSLGFFKLIKANKIAKTPIMLITVSLFSPVYGNILLFLYATFEQDFSCS